MDAFERDVWFEFKTEEILPWWEIALPVNMLLSVIILCGFLYFLTKQKEEIEEKEDYTAYESVRKVKWHLEEELQAEAAKFMRSEALKSSGGGKEQISMIFPLEKEPEKTVKEKGTDRSTTHATPESTKSKKRAAQSEKKESSSKKRKRKKEEKEMNEKSKKKAKPLECGKDREKEGKQGPEEFDRPNPASNEELGGEEEKKVNSRYISVLTVKRIVQEMLQEEQNNVELFQ
ncbi:hypothetical protein NECAME_10995, partial [Necator americanus]